jgi:antitoxin PrlF
VPRTKVTRNRQVTIPAEIAREAHISEGDILNVKMVGKGVLFEKASYELPVLKIGRRISNREIESMIAESAEEVSG